MTINDCQTFGKLFEAVEKISSIIALYTELETRMLIRVSALSAQLASSLVKLYTAVLQFLARTHSYYAQKTASKYIGPSNAESFHARSVSEMHADVGLPT